jgi:hypothetical protein
MRRRRRSPRAEGTAGDRGQVTGAAGNDPHLPPLASAAAPARRLMKSRLRKRDVGLRRRVGVGRVPCVNTSVNPSQMSPSAAPASTGDPARRLKSRLRERDVGLRRRVGMGRVPCVNTSVNPSQIRPSAAPTPTCHSEEGARPAPSWRATARGADRRIWSYSPSGLAPATLLPRRRARCSAWTRPAIDFDCASTRAIAGCGRAGVWIALRGWAAESAKADFAIFQRRLQSLSRPRAHPHPAGPAPFPSRRLKSWLRKAMSAFADGSG